MNRQNEANVRKNDQIFNNQIWRITDLAGYLKCSKGHLYNLVRLGEIPFRKKGRLLFFLPAEILNWIEEQQ